MSGWIALVAILAGCSGSPKPPSDSKPPELKPARSEVERGPVKVTVEVTPAKIRLSDEPTLTLTISYADGVTVRKPPFGESLGDFLVRDFREPLPQVEGGRQVLRQTYRLEPTRTGKLSIWPIPVTFRDGRPEGDGKEHTVETEGLTVDVATVLGSETPSLDQLRPLAGPVEPPSRGLVLVGLVALWMVVLLGLAGVIVYIWRRRRRPAEAPVVPPRELARQELERLLAQGLDRIDVKLFYVELTAIVRRYIERTTGIRAPEETTEEFLYEIRRRGTFPAEEGRRLGDFLAAADLVKFAAHQPHEDDIRESVDRARDFLGLAVQEAAA